MKRIFSPTYKICLLAAVLSLATNVKANDDAFRIADIRVEGLQRVSASPVFAALPIESGDFATDESVQLAVRSLFDTGFFDDIEVYRDGGVLIFAVKERPTITEIAIEGNKAIKTEMLEEAMAENELAEGQILQRGILDIILNELERQYVAQGRYSAAVEAEIEELPNNQVKINVNVDEGEVASIKHINIVGNEVFSDNELLDLFELNSTGWLSWLTSNDRYAREKLRGDIEKLESFYLDRGYLDFKIVSSQVSLSPDQKSVYITLNVDEGDIYKVSKIELAGDLILPEERFRRMILLREGSTFSQALMTTTSEYATELLANAGYTNAEVEGIPTPNPEDHTVEVTFLVNPSQRVYVRRIEFKGNTRTQDEVLRREMRQMEGAPASNNLIDQGKVRLERLSYFKEVNVENKEVPGTSDQIDIEYTVEEQPFASVNANVGYGQYAGFLIGASLQHNNWMGTGKQVSASVNHSEYQTLYNFSYSDPYFTPDGVNRGISLYYSKRDYSKINVSSYTTDRYGLNFSFGYPISEIQRLNYNFGYSHVEINTGQGVAQEIRRTPFELDLSDNDVFYTDMDALEEYPSPEPIDGVYYDFSYPSALVEKGMLVDTDPGFIDVNGDTFDTLNLGFTWLRSTLNRGIMATRGSKQVLSMEATVPGSDLEYVTVEYEGQVFQPLYRDFTLRFRTSLGYGDGYGEMDRLPFFKNFYSGGFGSVRGFEQSSLGPQATRSSYYETEFLDYVAYDSDNDGLNDGFRGIEASRGFVLCDIDGVRSDGLVCEEDKLARRYGALSRRQSNIGGNLKVEFGMDFIFPLPFIEDQRSFQTALFLDVGNVFDTECSATQVNCSKFDASELRASFGIGVNWLSAMGPLTFSLARPIRSEDGDDFKEFQFSLAAPF